MGSGESRAVMVPAARQKRMVGNMSPGTRTLQFAKPDLDGFLRAIAASVADGARTVKIAPGSLEAVSLTNFVSAQLPADVKVEALTVLPDMPVSESAGVAATTAWVLVPREGQDLASLLLHFLDWHGGWLIAPRRRTSIHARQCFWWPCPTRAPICSSSLSAGWATGTAGSSRNLPSLLTGTISSIRTRTRRRPISSTTAYAGIRRIPVRMRFPMALDERSS